LFTAAFTTAAFSDVNIDYAVLHDTHLTLEQEAKSSRAVMSNNYCVPPNRYWQGPVI
jgi:hypothetical protein